MTEENEVTANKLAEENQVTTKDPRKVEQGKRFAESNHIKREVKKGLENEVTANKLAEEYQVTTKNLNKVEAGSRLAQYNHRKREELKAQKQKSEDPKGRTIGASGVSQYYSVGAVLVVGVIGGLGYYLYQAKKGEVPPQQPSHPLRDNLPEANMFEMD